MKIAHGTVIVCSPGRNFVTLKLFTEDGVSRLGDATLNGRELDAVPDKARSPRESAVIAKPYLERLGFAG